MVQVIQRYILDVQRQNEVTEGMYSHLNSLKLLQYHP